MAYAPPSLKHIADLPSDAVERKVLCTAGDLIVTATDGLFDNVPDDIILESLNALPETDEIRTKGAQINGLKIIRVVSLIKLAYEL